VATEVSSPRVGAPRPRAGRATEGIAPCYRGTQVIEFVASDQTSEIAQHPGPTIGWMPLCRARHPLKGVTSQSSRIGAHRESAEIGERRGTAVSNETLQRLLPAIHVH
jgi:hypothetical protein